MSAANLGQNLREVEARTKSPVIGVVERGGRVVAKVMKVLSGENIRQFILSNVAPDESILMTDEFRSYNSLDERYRKTCYPSPRKICF